MATPPFPPGQSRIVSGRYPPPGADPHADAIRIRRGARGITPLDASLLHVPPIAGGFNALLGAVRTQGKLPDDVREVMILRVAALNGAAFEWIHHEPIARQHHISTGQLYAIRDVSTPLPAHLFQSSPLLSEALAFADRSTRSSRVSVEEAGRFKDAIRGWVLGNWSFKEGGGGKEAEVEATTEDLYVEAAMVVAAYNMVSRFLLATDVAALGDAEVPWPVERKEHFITVPSFPSSSQNPSSSEPTATETLETDTGPQPQAQPQTQTQTHTIHALTLTTHPAAPWLVFANSLLTDWSMWSCAVPYFLDLPSGAPLPPLPPLPPKAPPKNGDGAGEEGKEPAQTLTYNILLHSHRGHGLSSLPSPSLQSQRRTTVPDLAHDLAHLLSSPALGVRLPAEAVIGVSLGGAAALAFGALYGGGSQGESALTRSVVACDTAPRTPAGNRDAWAERVRLVYGLSERAGSAGSATDGTERPDQYTEKDESYARKVGMAKLAEVTVRRWFPPGSACYPGEAGSVAGPSSHSDIPAHAHSGSGSGAQRAAWIASMIARTPPRGFVEGARALSGYDLLGGDPAGPDSRPSPSSDTNTNTSAEEKAEAEEKAKAEKADGEERVNILQSSVGRVLLLAGSLDGGGRVGGGMEELCGVWNRNGNGVDDTGRGSGGERSGDGAGRSEDGTGHGERKHRVEYVEIEGAGHLPMVDAPERFCEVLGAWLARGG